MHWYLMSLILLLNCHQECCDEHILIVIFDISLIHSLEKSFSNWALLTFREQDCLVHFRMFSSITGLFASLPVAPPFLVVTTQTVPRHWPMSPGAKISPPLRISGGAWILGRTTVCYINGVHNLNEKNNNNNVRFDFQCEEK